MPRNSTRSHAYEVKKEQPLNNASLTLRYTREVSMGSHKNELSYALDIEAKIVGEFYDEEPQGDDERVIGYVKATIVQAARAQNDGEELRFVQKPRISTILSRHLHLCQECLR